MHVHVRACEIEILMEVFNVILQVRRYVYHDVVRLGDLEKLVNCSNIQVGQK